MKFRFRPGDPVRIYIPGNSRLHNQTGVVDVCHDVAAAVAATYEVKLNGHPGLVWFSDNELRKAFHHDSDGYPIPPAPTPA